MIQVVYFLWNLDLQIQKGTGLYEIPYDQNQTPRPSSKAGSLTVLHLRKMVTIHQVTQAKAKPCHSPEIIPALSASAYI